MNCLEIGDGILKGTTHRTLIWGVYWESAEHCSLHERRGRGESIIMKIPSFTSPGRPIMGKNSSMERTGRTRWTKARSTKQPR